MKKSIIFAFIIFVCALLAGCPLNPRTMVPKSPEQIRSYMAEKFGGSFEITAHESINNETQKLNVVSMSCSQLPGKTIVTTHGYEETIFGWHETFTTNYNRLYFQNEIETIYDDLIYDWFGHFDYRAVFANADTPESVEKYSSVSAYLEDSNTYIVYKVVIDASGAGTKDAAEIKARSVAYDIDETNYPISIDLYLWEDEATYQALDDDDIAELSSSHEYIFRDVWLENYSE